MITLRGQQPSPSAATLLALGLLPGAVAAQQAISSSPKDTTEYLRPLTTEDIFPTGVYGFVPAPPGIFVVDPVVNNSNPNLTVTDADNDGETSIAINPANPQEIVIHSGFGGWNGNAYWYHTLDGGTPGDAGARHPTPGEQRGL